MAVQIKIDQAGKPAGIAGKAREDLALGVAVVLTAVGGPFSAHQWTITYKPPNAALSALSAAVLTAPLASATNLAPIDNTGTYNIRLLVNSGSGLGASIDDVADITFYAGPTLNADPMLLPRRIPAAFEQGQHNVNDVLFPTGNPMGWALEWERWFRFIETAASVSYVNSVVQGLKAKEAVRLLSSTNIALTGVVVIDALNTATGDRIYVVGNTDPIENGIYIANDVGAWARATDMAAGSSAAGVYAFVREGAVGHADTGWICTTDAPADVVGTDPLTFALFTASPLATVAPLDVTKSAAVIGVSGKAAREDHKHNIVIDSDDVDWVAGVIPGTPTNVTQAIRNLAPSFLLKSLTMGPGTPLTLLTLDLDDVPTTVLQAWGAGSATAVGSVHCEIVAALLTGGGNVVVFDFQIRRNSGGTIEASSLSVNPVSNLNVEVLVNDGATLGLQLGAWASAVVPVLAVMWGHMVETP